MGYTPSRAGDRCIGGRSVGPISKKCGISRSAQQIPHFFKTRKNKGGGKWTPPKVKNRRGSNHQCMKQKKFDPLKQAPTIGLKRRPKKCKISDLSKTPLYRALRATPFKINSPAQKKFGGLHPTQAK
jgi:hypothetical protein